MNLRPMYMYIHSYAGSASAYMLFYVRRSHIDATLREGPVCLPETLRSTIETENADLATRRAEYEANVNTVELHPHFPDEYETVDGVVLRPRAAAEGDAVRASEALKIDRRKTVSALLVLLAELYVQMPPRRRPTTHDDAI